MNHLCSFNFDYKLDPLKYNYKIFEICGIALLYVIFRINIWAFQIYEILIEGGPRNKTKFVSSDLLGTKAC